MFLENHYLEPMVLSQGKVAFEAGEQGPFRSLLRKGEGRT